MDRTSKIFFLLLLILIVASLAFTAYRTLITKDFEVIETVVEEE